MTILLQPYCSSRVKPPSQLWESLNMRKMFITLAATSALALGACQSPQADKVEDQAEAQAEAIDDQADAMPEGPAQDAMRSEEHTSELQSLMRISYAVFCLHKKKNRHHTDTYH